ncbi:MAG: hypothetical protein WKG07_27890 [Hymenobacter sp.]
MRPLPACWGAWPLCRRGPLACCCWPATWACCLCWRGCFFGRRLPCRAASKFRAAALGANRATRPNTGRGVPHPARICGANRPSRRRLARPEPRPRQHLPEALAQYYRLAPAQADACGRAARTGPRNQEPIISDLRLHPGFAGTATGFRSLMRLPLHGRHLEYGTLYLPKAEPSEV